MTEGGLEKVGLLLDASTLRQPQRELKRLYRRAYPAGVKLYVSAPVYAEMQRSFKAFYGPAFNASTVDDYLKDNHIEVISFTREDADALVTWTDRSLPGTSHAERDGAWRLWKLRKAAHHVRPVVKHALQHLNLQCQPHDLAPALDKGAHDAAQDKVHLPGTMDWLLLGIAHQRGLAIVTEENPARELSEFQFYPHCYCLDEAIALFPGAT